MKVTQNVQKNDKTSYDFTSAVRPETRVDNAVKKVVCDTAKTETKNTNKNSATLVYGCVWYCSSAPYS